MHSSYIPQSSSRLSSRRTQISQSTPSTPTSTRRPGRAGRFQHRRKLSNPASLNAPQHPVTPTPEGQHAAWADLGSPRSLPLSHPHAVPPEVVLGHSHSRIGMASDQRSIISDMGKTYGDAHHVPVDDDMPMDEAEDVMHHLNPAVLDGMRQQVEESQKEVERLTILLQKSQARAVDAADRGGGVGAAAMADDVSSLGDEDNAPSKLTKLIQGIEQSRKPLNLSAEEKSLWGAYQKSLTNAQVESSKERKELEQQVLESASQLNSVRVREKILQEQLEETAQELQSLQSEMRSLKENKEKSLEEQQRLKAAQAMTLRRLEDQLAEMETKYKEAQALVDQQQEEHDRAICAIQRVLADVTSERDKVVEDLQAKLDAAERARAEGSAPPETPVEGTATRALELESETGSLKTLIETTEKGRDTVQQDLDEKGGKIAILEQELKRVKDALEKAEEKTDDITKKLDEKSKLVVTLEGELASAKHEVETLTKREHDMEADVEAKKKEIQTLRRRQRHMRLGESEAKSREIPPGAKSTESPTGNVAALQEQLEETQASLENAKKIILSLESASGSLATDLRGKLKEKEEQLQTLQTEATERKRTLDSLATELRDLQRRKGEMDRMDTYSRNLIRKQQVLSLELETTLNNLQESAIVIESSMESGTLDPEAIDNVSKILANALGSVKYASMDVKDSPSAERSYSIDSSKTDGTESPKHTRAELEERKLQVNRLEEALKQHKEELEALHRESAQSQLKREEEDMMLRSEVLKLREQCRTNMEVLAMKERELEVLRDSLDVEGDKGGGYISDDASSYGEEEEEAARQLNLAPLSPGAGSVYSHSQAEALATLMANGSGVEASMNTSMTSMSVTEVEKLRMELSRANNEKEKAAKELKAERESLANAKMIISSLERANKSMMEDLRQRLQDSNTAIASLLDKSMQSEKLSSSLKDELDTERSEREEEAKKHKAEIERLQDEVDEQTRMVAAKDREIQDMLRKQVAASPVEEPAGENDDDN